MDIYRVTKDSPQWQHKVYEYARTDAFVFGQGIPIEAEYSHDEPIDEDYKAVIIVDNGKPVAGCRITFPADDIGKIGRVCVTREYQKSGIGTLLIGEAEKWILERDVSRIVINSQDRAQGFYEKVGYELVPGVDPHPFESRLSTAYDDIPRDYVPKKNPLGFSCVLVEKKIS
ncbi:MULTISPECIES: GNAT family N-acetyltransferase [unclassified Butyrivibrio]|uniref:GNAT family N-acetyltransferase n=1 Tax=unclassified Butyrivibrio TaxID=2639466 RepID=UPI0003B2E611|nr:MULTISPECIES: GNAT family N-acetyltransferase [unclassified Butyrivibrio]